MLSILDWGVLLLFVLFPFAVAFLRAEHAGRSLHHFFLADRQLPWWLAGTSMVATTFAADTPLAVTGIVAREGIAGNWIWWNGALGSMLSVLFFAHLWRRAGVVTDVEFIELRYSGKNAAVLRGFRAVYLGLLINCVVIGWVNLAMAKLLSIVLGWDQLTAVFTGFALTTVYVAISGLGGVVLTDLLQFGFAVMGSLAVAIFALGTPKVGGLQGVAAQLPESILRPLPYFEQDSPNAETRFTISLATFLAYLGVQWWATWYPGQEPGGGGYLAQRMMAVKDERQAILATLWFTICHYCVRPWPWILAALASLLLYPDIADHEAGYAMLIRDHVPIGWRGLVLGGFAAAYMSTVSTQLNWGASYLINDLYARFICSGATETHYVRAARFSTLIIMGFSVVITLHLETVRQAWEFILEAGAGIGLVLILRWYWWRVNAWSEVTAMVAPLLGLVWISFFTAATFPDTLLYLVCWSTVCWLSVTYLTSPEPESTLVNFFERINPSGAGWREVSAKVGKHQVRDLLPRFTAWFAACLALYGLLLGVGELLLPTKTGPAPYFATSLACCFFLYHRSDSIKLG